MLLDNGRTRVLRDEVGRQALALHPLQRLPERLPRLHAHGRPRVRLGLSRADRRDPHAAARGIENAASLPFASSLCGACYEVCPVKIDIPAVLAAPARAGVARRRFASARRCEPSRGRSTRAAGRFASSRSAARACGRSACSRSAERWTQTRELKSGPRRELPRLVAARAHMTDARAELLGANPVGHARRAAGRDPDGVSGGRGTLDREHARRLLLRARRRLPRRGSPRDRCRRGGRRQLRASVLRPASSCRPACRTHGGRPAIELVDDAGFSPTELDRMDGVITGCTVAIAETGTIVLVGGRA